MSETTKERVYDAQIAPLMQQIIAICKRDGIPVYASFALDGDLLCTTFVAPPRADIPAGDRDTAEVWLMAHDRAAVMIGAETAAPLTLTTRDASGKVKDVVVIL